MTQTTRPPMFGVHHAAFTVRDLEASVAWYVKVFGAVAPGDELPHYGREWTGHAELVLDQESGLAIGLHHNEQNGGEEFDESRTGLDHLAIDVRTRENLEAWAAWLDHLGVAHSAIQSVTEPLVYSTVVFRDIDNIQLEVVAFGV
jgi:glyoxylase I family protein